MTYCNEYVDGGIMSWPCRLQAGHDGPHEAVEVPASGRRRQLWLDAQTNDLADVSVQSSAPLPLPSLPSILDAGVINDEKHRMDVILSVLSKKEISSLPSAVSSWAMGMLAQTSLLVLWEMAQNEFNDGAQSVVITRDYLDRLVPKTLLVYLGKV